MAKAPPSAKRDRIKAFTPALVDYTNDEFNDDVPDVCLGSIAS